MSLIASTGLSALTLALLSFVAIRDPLFAGPTASEVSFEPIAAVPGIPSESSCNCACAPPTPSPCGVITVSEDPSFRDLWWSRSGWFISGFIVASLWRYCLGLVRNILLLFLGVDSHGSSSSPLPRLEAAPLVATEAVSIPAPKELPPLAPAQVALSPAARKLLLASLRSNSVAV